MRASAIIRIVLYSVVALALVGVLLWGISAYNNNSFSEFLGKISFNLGTGVRYSDEASYTIGQSSCPDEGITEIEVFWTSGKVNIEAYDGDEITFSETADRELNEPELLRWRVLGNTLTIHFSKSGYGKWVGLSGKSLTLLIPRELAEGLLTGLKVNTVSAEQFIGAIKADVISLESVSGSINAAGLQSGKAVLEAVSGNVTATSLDVTELEVQSVSGRIRTAGSFAEGDFDSTSGSIELSCTSCPALKVNTVSGAITLTIPEDSGFTAKFSSVSGDLHCNIASVTEGHTTIAGDGSKVMRFDTVSGDLTIAKAN